MPRTIDAAVLTSDYIAAMEKCLDKILDYYYREIIAAMRTDAGKNDVTVEKLNDMEKGLLLRRVISGGYGVVDSFGTGESMSANNPAWEEYANSDMYNPSRSKSPNAQIVGRPKGEYIDIFGEKQYSSGRFDGVPLVGFLDSPIKNVTPSGALQDAWSWLIASDMVREELKNTTATFFAHVYTNSNKYWKSV